MLLANFIAMPDNFICMQTQKNPEKVLLLLSGGKDSALAAERLLREGHKIRALCIDGKQGVEKVGALATARLHKIDLDVISINFFDETTWNPFKLILRDIAMGIFAIKFARDQGASCIATGVKKSDIQTPALWWLGSFLSIGRVFLRCFGLKLIFPVWDSQ